MDSLLVFLPVTVVAAILIFVLKESVEGWRRYRSEERTKKALRKLLAFECERNNFTVHKFRTIAQLLESHDHTNELANVFSLKWSKNGRITFHFHFQTHDNGSGGSIALPIAHRQFMSQQLLTVATLDKKLYEKFQPALDSVNEMEHIRESLIYHMEDPESFHLWTGFAEYALEELDSTQKCLAALYFECTGRPLESRRVR